MARIYHLWTYRVSFAFGFEVLSFTTRESCLVYHRYHHSSGHLRAPGTRHVEANDETPKNLL